ncbi:PD40 domain-containing protein [Plantactinospora sp. BB1]|uniref:PD40 domain-containing protein n=1 Tax=Plantactinospora sp. BB1 TaxID=2071627 RepID=UPI000D17576B|nr:PD40 domain-containing protein [Plantactinospora sp. BB1]AVT41027.1 hypothetical protein C6W10_36480 [Plantactinospora sp. BB1]
MPRSPAGTPRPPAELSIPGLPGTLYYTDGERLLRLTRTGLHTVLSTGAHNANVSPDGNHIAYIDHNDNVIVTDRDGNHRRTVMRHSIQHGYSPAWSPDSRKLLVARSTTPHQTTLGTLTIATTTFTPLAKQPPEAIHPLWSADGRHLGYATGTCQIGTADHTGRNARITPTFGSPDTTTNPQRRRSCDPLSISPDGSKIAVNQRTGDQNDGDIARDLTANTTINTHTGATIRLPVTGTITAIHYQPDNTTLIRTRTGNTHHLTLLNPDHTTKTHLTEPTTTRNLHLLTHTPH